MITTYQILTALQAACAADATLLQAVRTLFGEAAVLTLQVGGQPQREVTAQDCPLVAFLDAGAADTGLGPDTKIWRFPLELQCYVCSNAVTETANPPAGTRLLTVAAPVLADQFAAVVRVSVVQALNRLGLTPAEIRPDLEPMSEKTWPRQRAVLTILATIDHCYSAEPELSA
jgi:hypothetical protein